MNFSQLDISLNSGMDGLSPPMQQTPTSVFSDSEEPDDEILPDLRPVPMRKRRALKRARRAFPTSKRPRTSSDLTEHADTGGKIAQHLRLNGLLVNGNSQSGRNIVNVDAFTPSKPAEGLRADPNLQSESLVRNSKATLAFVQSPSPRKKVTDDDYAMRDAPSPSKATALEREINPLIARAQSNHFDDEGHVKSKTSVPSSIWMRLSKENLRVDEETRPDSRFVSLKRPLDCLEDLKTSITVTLFSDGYVIHDSDSSFSVPGAPVPGKLTLGSVSSSHFRQCSINVQSVLDVAMLPRYPYDRSSRDFLLALDLGVLPPLYYLPPAERCTFYDGCIVAEVNDARYLDEIYPGNCSRDSATSSFEKLPKNARAKTTQCSPHDVDSVTRPIAKESACLPSHRPPVRRSPSMHAVGNRMHETKEAERQSFIKYDVSTFKILLRPDPLSITEDVERLTSFLEPSIGKAVEQLLLRFTARTVQWNPLPRAISKHSCNPFSPIWAPARARSCDIRSRRLLSPSLSAATLMFVAGADKQHVRLLQDMKLRRIVAEASAQHSNALTPSADENTAVLPQAVSSRKDSSSKGNGKGTVVADSPSNSVDGANALAGKVDGSASEKAREPPEIILCRRNMTDKPSATAATNDNLRNSRERIRTMRLVFLGRQAATAFQLAEAARSAGTKSSEGHRQATQEVFSSLLNNSRSQIILEIRRRGGVGCEVLIWRSTQGELSRDAVTLSLGNVENCHAFLEQFRLVTKAEGYVCYQDVFSSQPQRGSLHSSSQMASHRPIHDQAMRAQMHQAVLQAAQYQQISQSQVSQRPFATASHQQLTQLKNLPQHQGSRLQTHQQQQSSNQSPSVQQRLVQQSANQITHSSNVSQSSSQKPSQLPRSSPQSYSVSQQQAASQKLPQHGSQYSSGQAVSGQRSKQTPQPQQLQVLNSQQAQSQHQQLALQLKQMRPSPNQQQQKHLNQLNARQNRQEQQNQARLQQQVSSFMPHRGQHQSVTSSALATSSESQNREQPAISLASDGNHFVSSLQSHPGALVPGSFPGIANGAVNTNSALSAAIRAAQAQPLHSAIGRMSHEQDVLAFASQYTFQQNVKQPTKSQQHHRLLLQQQIAIANRNGPVLQRPPVDQPVQIHDIAGSFREEDLQMKSSNQSPQQSRDRKPP